LSFEGVCDVDENGTYFYHMPLLFDRNHPLYATTYLSIDI